MPDLPSSEAVAAARQTMDRTKPDRMRTRAVLLKALASYDAIGADS